MTFDTENVKAGRKPYSECELVLDSCRFEYGESYTNLALQSEDLNTTWSLVNTTVTSNAMLAPDGTMTANKVEDTSAVAGSYVQQIISSGIANFGTYCFSVFLHEGTQPEPLLWMQFDNGGTTHAGEVRFRLSDASAQYVDPDIITYGVKYIGDGWRRYWIVLQNNGTGNTRLTFRLQNEQFGTFAETGYYYVWGAQVMNLNHPGHYVKTTTTSATAGCSASNAKGNLWEYSSQFDNALWLKGANTAVSANVVFNHLANAAGDKIYATAAAAFPYVVNPITVASGITCTQSAHVKAAEITKFQLILYGSLFNGGGSNVSVYFDLTSGAIESVVNSPEDYGIESVGGGWYRCWITHTTTAAISAAAPGQLRAGEAATLINDGFYMWGAQFVEGSIPGIYYETTTTAHTGTIGTECYNTWSSCEVQDDYLKLIKGHRYSMPVHPVIPGTIPCMITEPRFTSAIADPDNGLGVRSQVSINLRDFAHHDRGFDPYVYGRTYAPQNQGTHFGKTLARNPYWTGRPLIVRTGYHTDTGQVTRTRAYVLDKFSLDDNASIVGKDLLKLADNSRTQIPTLSDAELLADITAVATSCTLDDYDQLPDASGTLAIGDEVMDYVKVGSPATSLTLSNRGKYGTTAEAHDAGDNVQHCYIFTQNVVDEIFDLLNIYVGIGKQYLPYDAKQDVPTGTNDEWDDEYDLWLVGHNFNGDGIIVKPTGVADVIRVLTRISAIYLWWDEIDQKIKLKANMPPAGNPTIPVINENSHFVKNSVRTKELPDQRISQATIHYNRIVATGDDKASNYAGHTSRRDANSESANEYGTKRIREYFAKYYATAAVPTAAANRLVNRYRTEPKDVWFDLDAKDESIRIGDTYDIETRRVQDVTGANETYRIQIQEMRETKVGHLYTYRGRTSVFDRRYMFIGTTGIPDYGSATDAQKATVGFISSAGGGDFADGGSAYYII